MKYITTRLLFLLVLPICSLALLSADTLAAPYTVTNTANSGTDSLREAITRANSSREDDTITFSIPPTAPNCNGNGVCTIFLDAEFAINATSTAGKLTISNATGASRLLISGNTRTRVFYLNYGADLTLDGVTVTGGNGVGTTDPNSNGSGGAIFQNYGTKLMLTNSAVTNSNASTNGGGIYIWSYFNGSLTMMNSTVSGNTSNFGGGIQNDCGAANICGGVKIYNSTLSGNTAQSYGGAVYNNYYSTVTMTNATVTNNRSVLTCPECTGGVYNYRDPVSTVSLVNTIIAGNNVGNPTAVPDFSGAVSSTSSYNIIGSNKLMTGISDGSNGNQIGTSTFPLNPQLGSLTENGGGTQTHAPLPLSPALDRGNNCVLTAGGCDGTNPALTGDQRGAGFSRQSGNGVDVGAVEIPQSLGGFDISGTVVYGTTPVNQPQKFVPGVTVSAIGVSSVSTTTDSTGYYMLRNLASGGSYTVTPAKSGSVNGVSSFDATLVLRYVASGGTEPFTANQKTAADTNNDGSITSFDATQILRFVASGNSGASSGVAGSWKFVASFRTYGQATNSYSGENYDAILVGDVNGDWSPIAASPAEATLTEDNQIDLLGQTDHPQVRVSLPEFARFERGAATVVPLIFTNNSGAPISSFNFAVGYDSKLLQPDAEAVDVAEVLSNDAGCAVVTDQTTAGRIGIAVSCPRIGITGAVTQLNLRFTATGKARSKAGNFPALTFLQKPIFEDGSGQVLPVKVVSFSGK